jgi:hypothetical protein
MKSLSTLLLVPSSQLVVTLMNVKGGDRVARLHLRVSQVGKIEKTHSRSSRYAKS